VSVRICVPREDSDGETRVGLTPDAVKRLSSDDVSIAIEAGAGDAAGFLDSSYSEMGAEIVSERADLLGSADVVFKVGR